MVHQNLLATTRLASNPYVRKTRKIAFYMPSIQTTNPLRKLTFKHQNSSFAIQMTTAGETKASAL